MCLSKAKYIVFLSAITLILWGLQAQAKFINWQSANIQLLKGWDYEIGEERRAIITLEYANDWKYGDLFTFVDGTRYVPGKTTAYGELSPRFSLSKISGNNISYSIIKDVLIATTLEKGKSNTKAYLYGAGIDLNIPGFKFFQSNFYVRDNPEIQNDNTWQITLAWRRPLEIKGQKFLFEGFADFAGKEGSTYHKNQLIVPRFLWDIGNAMGKKDGKLYGGIEYSYWHNKFGIDGKTESTPQLQLKWVF